jgi:HD-like signal output (HDOD) protein
VEIQELFEGDIEIPIPPEVYYDFLEQLNNLVLSTVVMDRFKSIPDSVINMESFWKHNIGFGLAARTIASLKKEVNTERFFVAGILHDLGRLVLAMSTPFTILSVFMRCKSEEIQLHEAEKTY